MELFTCLNQRDPTIYGVSSHHATFEKEPGLYPVRESEQSSQLAPAVYRVHLLVEPSFRSTFIPGKDLRVQRINLICGIPIKLRNRKGLKLHNARL